MAPKKKPRDLETLLQDDALIESALRAGVREALLRHKQLGSPLSDGGTAKLSGFRRKKSAWETDQ